jgi:2-amino-4-hydroxy-6-hydroxymethyldihydropteridine diphosphokinase
MKATISLGSNLGDRFQYLQNALDSINEVTGTQVHSVSPVFETDPVGGPEQPKYLNAVLIAETQLDPHELLISMLEIENKLGRKREIHWGPRTIDLDLIVVGDEVVVSDVLVLPHPRAHERKFVLEPWLEIDPTAQIPGIGLVESILQRI